MQFRIDTVDARDAFVFGRGADRLPRGLVSEREFLGDVAIERVRGELDAEAFQHLDRLQPAGISEQ